MKNIPVIKAETLVQIEADAQPTIEALDEFAAKQPHVTEWVHNNIPGGDVVYTLAAMSILLDALERS